ncbi:RNA methyltransferase [Fulvivirga sedimenti]|uniref:RNA methyltransferase n=1 Tax=Fulvivirga sedimenti TaxID=2879465 RepID=A0A9X1HV46_9BACT|nr:RNA methyltransferase [Fulvivirga sedimenti]MCA6078480.1 RNA methyltransferase [Fulvivirga sedimenti]
MVRKLSNDELGRKSVGEFRKSEKQPIAVVLDNVRSMHNVGSIFRSADAFLIERIILTGITACPPHREIQKTALGATESVDWTYVEKSVDAVRELRAEGYKIIAIEQTEPVTELQEFMPEPNQKYALVFGNEVFGVAEEIVAEADVCIEIPQFGTKHSLNVAVSAGVVMWEFVSRLK